MTATLTKIKNRFAKTGADPVPSSAAVKARSAHLPVLPAGTPLSIPPAVLRALRQVIAKQERVNLAECAVLLLALLPALWLMQGLADWWFNLPWGVRFLFFLADLSVVGLIIFRFGWLPWKKRLNLERAALRVEKEIPAFRTALISTVELAAAKAGCTQGSLSLVNELLARVNRQVQTMNLAVLWSRLPD